MDQWEYVLDPLMDLQDVTYVYNMLSKPLQPFYMVFWCCRMLLLSCHGELCSQRMPNSAGMPYRCLLHSEGLVCDGCCHLDSSTFAYYVDQTSILKQLMVECIQTAISITADYYYPYVFLKDFFTRLNLISFLGVMHIHKYMRNT